MLQRLPMIAFQKLTWLEWSPVVYAGAASAGVVYAAYRLIEKRRRKTDAGRGMAFAHLVTMLVVTMVGLLATIVFIPDKEMRGDILSFLGILLSAAIALSSTTLLGNAMAGVTLRAVKNFRLGDAILVGDHFGYITEFGLIHTRIQTEDLDLTTLPNLYLATQPVKVVRGSGTILWAEVSLGYDVSRSRVEELLLRAIDDVEELESPRVVQVLGLGDFSVQYRAGGKCEDTHRMVAVRSLLRAAMLDRLHEGGVEIVSPTYMNTRAQDPGTKDIPQPALRARPSQAEEVVLDKAEEASTLQRMREELVTLDREIEAAKQAGDKEQAAQLAERKQGLVEAIADQESGSAETS